MIRVIEEMGISFLDKDNDLYCLGTKIVMYPSVTVVHEVQSIETCG